MQLLFPEQTRCVDRETKTDSSSADELYVELSQSVSMPPLFRIQRFIELRKSMCTHIQVPSFSPVFLVLLNIPEPLLPLERGSERSNKSLCFPRY